MVLSLLLRISSSYRSFVLLGPEHAPSSGVLSFFAPLQRVGASRVELYPDTVELPGISDDPHVLGHGLNGDCGRND